MTYKIGDDSINSNLNTAMKSLTAAEKTEPATLWAQMRSVQIAYK
jgi:hypothetical protein